MGMDRQLKLKERQLLKAKEMNKTKDSAIKQLRFSRDIATSYIAFFLDDVLYEGCPETPRDVHAS